METKDIAIIALAMIVVLLVGYMLGQRRRDGKAIATDKSNLADAVESPPPVVISARSDVISAPPPSRDYSKQISQAQLFHNRVAVVYSALAENKVYAPFNEAYGRIDESYQSYNIDKQEHTWKELLSLLSSVIDAARFGDTQKNLAAAAGEIAKSIIDYYDEQLDTLFSGQPFEGLGSKYRLNSDLRASQLAKISAIVLNHFSTVIAEARDVEQRRIWLQGNYQNVVNVTKDEIDWGSTARSFGAGALAVANPIIGIPALIANFKHQSDKSKAENAHVDRYLELFDEFEEKVFSLRQQIIQSAEQTKSYVKEKFSEVNGVAIAALLSDTAESGCIINHYFNSLDVKELEDAERELLSEGA